MHSKRRLRWAAVPIGIVAAFVLAGCTPTELHGFLPGFTEDGQPATDRTDMVAGLWTTSWIVLLAVGIITWGLMFWAAIAYRRRKGQTGLPVQLRYNMPIEIFYTIVPFILIIGMFAFTARDQNILETQFEDPDVSIVAYGKQWAWDFQYNGEDEDQADAVWSMGIQAQIDDTTGDVDQAQLPTLYLPVNKTVRIDLRSRDVIHSFWIIDFLYKKDMYIGHDNSWSFTPTREGEYAGKCAELCGEYHSEMLFTVKVVSESEYEAYLATLRAKGQTGPITDEYNRLANLPGTGATTGEEGH
ncbi:MAG: cytochrome c oxidase subunit II [Microbacterium sp.]